MNQTRSENPMTLRRGPLLLLALLAAAGSAVIYLVPLPAEFHLSVPFGIVFAVLGLAQLGTIGAAAAKPTVRRLWHASGASGAVVLFWALTRIGGVFTPDPWQPVNAELGFNDDLCAALAATAALILGVLAALGTRPRRSRRWRVLTGLGLIPLAPVIAIATLVGVLAATDSFAGAGFPSDTVAPVNLPAGQRATLEYCRPEGVPLAMDIYTPPAGAARPAPVALYVHGGGLIFGDRQLAGFGATMADQQGALFTPLQQQLNARGFLVASIDYRLPPATAWPAQIQDAKCAVRFLRAHATGLGIDPTRIGAWGSSAGGLLVSLLGLTRPADGFDVGQYTDQSSAIGAVVDMFGPADLNDLTGSETVMKLMVSIGLGDTPTVRRSVRPLTYVHPGAPPFLILQGTDDNDVPPHQSELLAARLHTATVPTNLIIVHGAGHSLATPGQNPSPEQLTTTTADFLASTLSTGRP